MVKNKYVIGIALVLLLSIITVVMAAAPSIDTISPPSSQVSSTEGVSQTFSFNANQTVNITWKINGTEVPSSSQTNVTSGSYTNSSPVVGFWNVTAEISNINGTITNQWDWTVNAAAPSAPAISSPQPSSSSSVNSNIGVAQTFNVTVNQTANVSWKIGVNEIQNLSVAADTKSEFTNSTTGIGEYTVTAQAFNENGSSSIQSWTWNITSSGPDPVTNISATKGATWINWTWTNPGGDFNYTIVRINDSINDTWQANTTYEYFNYTSFAPGTSNKISLQTVDIYGFLGSANADNEQYTDNTPTGYSTRSFTNVSLAFSNVVGSGNTSVTTTTSSPGTHTAFDPVGLYYVITSTANLGGNNVTVGLTYTVPSGYYLNDIRMYHFNTSWEEVTTTRDGTYVYGNVTSFSTFVLGVPPKPIFTDKNPDPSTTVETIGVASRIFKVKVDQNVNISWYSDVDVTTHNMGLVLTGNEANYTYTPSAAGNYTVSVNATNTTTGLSNTTSWNWTVRPKTYETGNRVWDANKDMSLKYTWNPMSFYAFYYDLDSNVGNETLQVTLQTKTDRTIDKGDLAYTATPDNVSFKYKAWGSYNVIGFMAEKYFAGYTAGSTGITSTPISTVNSKQLHKILSDDNTKRTIYVGGTVTLAEGYVLKAKDIDVTGGKTVLISLLKDGGEVDSTVVAAGGTYIYQKKVGAISDVPIIAIHIDTVFVGAEANAAFLNGLFQISESYTSINDGNRYGIMKITGVSDTTGITMENENSLSLAAGTTNDVMGDIKFKVANNGSVLRFAPFVQKTGVYDVRGTISNNETDAEWTPMNFEGFYYDLDEDVGSENITLKRTDRTVSENNFIYTSKPQSVSFEYSKFGSYNVIGFMAQKYFAGYIGSVSPIALSSIDISTINSKQLHKVLTDDETRRTIYGGSTLTLNEGYVLKIKDVDVTGGKTVLLSLLKDGNEIDTTAIAQGNTYVYQKKVGTVSDLPIIAVNIETVFVGAEANAAFVKGIFQISESYTSVNQGDRYGIMEITAVDNTKIEMLNKNAVTLSAASNIDVMGAIKFKVADDSIVRFYPYITIDSGVTAANQLTIDAPARPTERETITIKVTAGSGTAVEGAEVSFDNTVIGTTNSAGKVNYTLTSSGLHNISATKLGYEAATKSITVDAYVETRLSIELPAIIDQGVPVTIKVTSGENTVAGASITLDSAAIGTTDIRGELNYSFDVSGTHNLGASKTDYISVVREITIRMPFSEYKALDINLSPPVIFEGDETVIKANITNIGTKADSREVELIINGTVVDNKSLILEPGEVKEINFTREVELPMGNYTVEILGKTDVLRVEKKETSLLLIGGILTGIGAILIYLFTSKKLTIAMVKQSLANLNAETIKEGLRNAGWKLKDMFNEVISKFRKP
jgi:S-layer protein (TIGR01567 family)